MIKKNLKIILFILLCVLQGCSCSCNTVSPPSTSDFTTSSSSIIVYADACAPSDGSSAVEGKSYSSSVPVPNAQCDNWTNGNPSNRGRWVMVPPPQSTSGGMGSGGLTVTDQSTVTITAYGTAYYCSSGYDNTSNNSPYAAVFPGTSGTSYFSNGSQMSVEKGQLIILNIGDPSSGCSYAPGIYCSSGNGVAIGSTGATAASLPACTFSSTTNQYNEFLQGECRATGGMGLTVYINDSEVVTLDGQTSTSGNSYYTSQTSRAPELYATLISSSQASSFEQTVDTDYGVDIAPANNNQYLFMAPYSGVLSFAIAEETIISGSPGGYGQYNVTVITAPTACAVNSSEATKEGNRGALQVLFEETTVNPNQTDTVLQTFNNYDPTLSIYYPELMQYLAQSADVQINSSAAELNNLLVPSTGTTNEEADGTPTLNPTVLTTQTSTLYSGTNGYIWLKIKDDYYHDNVGGYEVNVSVQTPNGSILTDFLNALITPIINSLTSASAAIYGGFFSSSNNFTAILHMCMLLFIMVLGGQYLLGLNSMTLKDGVIRLFKLAVVIELLEPTSWGFYNQYFFNIYTQGQNFLISATTGDYSSNHQGVFGFVNDVFNTFFSFYTWQQILALLPDFIGFLYALVLIMVMFIYLTALTQVFIVYLLALIGMYILMSLAPMFMVLILFERTRKIFQSWLKYLFAFAIQPVILFAVLYIMNEIFMSLWDSVMGNITICYGGDPTWTLYFYGVYIWTFETVQPFTIGCIYYYWVTSGYSAAEMFAGIMMLYFFALNTQAIISYGPKISDSISGAGSASALTNLGAKITSSAAKSIMGDSMSKYQKMNRLQNRQAHEDKFADKVDKKREKINKNFDKLSKKVKEYLPKKKADDDSSKS